MNDQQMQRLIRMVGEASWLESSAGAQFQRGSECLGMSDMQSRADSGKSLSVSEELHLRACPLCAGRWKAMRASRPAAVRATAPTRWYRHATGVAAAAACVGALLTIVPRGEGPTSSGPVLPMTAVVASSATPVFVAPAPRLRCTPGDANCDGVVDRSDLTALGMAVHQPEEYAARFPNCDAVCSSDLNGDSVVDECDLDELMQCVGG